MSAKCKSCGAAIVWAKTTSGRTMPVDAEPTDDGTIHLNGSDCEVLSKADREAVLAADDLSGRYTRLHKSHFSTCPQAARHRKPKS